MEEEASPAVVVDRVTRVYQSGKGLRKKGEEVVALDCASLTVAPGEIHGLLGPNGAGKTTLVKILSTVLLPTSGRATVLGYDVVEDVEEVRSRIGIVFGGERGLYLRLTARQNLRYWAALYKLPDRVGKPRTEELLGRVGLGEWADRRVETFSRGMKQRLHLARGLIGDPEVVFLDEPTTGMDPVAAHEFRALVKELRTEGRTILLTTHDMAEAETVCERVSLIDRGQILATEPPRTLSGWISRFERIDVEGADDALVSTLAGIPGVAGVERRDDGSVRVETEAEGAAQAVLEALVAGGVTSVRTSLPSLEEVYLHVFGGRGLEV